MSDNLDIGTVRNNGSLVEIICHDRGCSDLIRSSSSPSNSVKHESRTVVAYKVELLKVSNERPSI